MVSVTCLIKMKKSSQDHLQYMILNFGMARRWCRIVTSNLSNHENCSVVPEAGLHASFIPKQDVH
jgi:hypothetical protein